MTGSYLFILFAIFLAHVVGLNASNVLSQLLANKSKIPSKDNVGLIRRNFVGRHRSEGNPTNSNDSGKQEPTDQVNADLRKEGFYYDYYLKIHTFFPHSEKVNVPITSLERQTKLEVTATKSKQQLSDAEWSPTLPSDKRVYKGLSEKLKRANVDGIAEKTEPITSGVYRVKRCSQKKLDRGVKIIGWGNNDHTDFWLDETNVVVNWLEKRFIKKARNHGELCVLATTVSYPDV